jgi:hypothetical protein
MSDTKGTPGYPQGVVYLLLCPLTMYLALWFWTYYLGLANGFLYGFIASSCFALILPLSIFFMWRYYRRKQSQKVFFSGGIPLLFLVLTWLGDYLATAL